MASPNRPARLNRALLLLVSVILLAAAAFILLTAFGALTLLRLPACPRRPGSPT